MHAAWSKRNVPLPLETLNSTRLLASSSAIQAFAISKTSENLTLIHGGRVTVIVVEFGHVRVRHSGGAADRDGFEGRIFRAPHAPVAERN
jgi:hypothetical protein